MPGFMLGSTVGSTTGTVARTRSRTVEGWLSAGSVVSVVVEEPAALGASCAG
jgi:hypothetical protein